MDLRRIAAQLSVAPIRVIVVSQTALFGEGSVVGVAFVVVGSGGHYPGIRASILRVRGFYACGSVQPLLGEAAFRNNNTIRKTKSHFAGRGGSMYSIWCVRHHVTSNEREILVG